jgi:hypothetical protein
VTFCRLPLVGYPLALARDARRAGPQALPIQPNTIPRQLGSNALVLSHPYFSNFAGPAAATLHRYRKAGHAAQPGLVWPLMLLLGLEHVLVGITAFTPLDYDCQSLSLVSGIVWAALFGGLVPQAERGWFQMRGGSRGNAAAACMLSRQRSTSWPTGPTSSISAWTLRRSGPLEPVQPRCSSSRCCRRAGDLRQIGRGRRAAPTRSGTVAFLFSHLGLRPTAARCQNACVVGARPVAADSVGAVGDRHSRESLVGSRRQPRVGTDCWSQAAVTPSRGKPDAGRLTTCTADRRRQTDRCD